MRNPIGLTVIREDRDQNGVLTQTKSFVYFNFPPMLGDQMDLYENGTVKEVVVTARKWTKVGELVIYVARAGG